VDEVALSDRSALVELRRHGDLSGEWDPDRLEQAIGNLVANAIRHAPPGTPVRLHAIGEEDLVRIQVENDGPAIPREAIASLFDPFQAPVTGGAGLGLGLFIVRTIVEAHGGRVDVESPTGAPVTFTVRLPRRRSPASRDAPAASVWRPIPGDPPHRDAAAH
jgi:signal transduction histidine kinase